MHGKDLIIVGDFNTIGSQDEKRGGTKVRDPFGEKMEDLIVDLDLLDISLRNMKYMWSNKRVEIRHVATSMDRFLVSSTLL